MRPNFIVIGAQKAGTNSLYRYLRSHPQVFMPETKEPDYFIRELNWDRGLAWYEQQFQGAGDATAIGEASTRYSMHPRFPGVPERIARLLPDVRLIYVVRHPLERMRSAHAHQILVGEERSPIEEALLRDPYYVDATRYAMQISRYLRYFPRQQLLVFTSEELRDAREATIQRVFRFLGVDPDWRPPELDREFYRTADRAALPGSPVLPGDGDPRRAGIPERVRRRLEDMLRDDVRDLRAYLGDEFDGWGLA